MYLLDTDTLSNLLKRSPAPQLIEKLAAVPVEQQFTSSITFGELAYGVHRETARTAMLLPRIEAVVRQNLAILPFDAEAAGYYGRLRAELERAGTPLADADLRIASIALARTLTLVTANVRHFARVPGLPIENWLA